MSRDADAPLLQARGLGCRRGARWLWRDVDLVLPPGQVLELRGANGSGKSSLLRVLAGLLPATAGTVERPARFAYLGHLNGLCADLTVDEHLRFADRCVPGVARMRPDDEAAAIDDALAALGVSSLRAQAVRRLSQGQRRRVALARVRASGHRLWLLDEPLAALDDDGQQRCHAMLRAHLAAGGAAIVATHQALDLPPALRRVLLLSTSHRRDDAHRLAA